MSARVFIACGVTIACVGVMPASAVAADRLPPRAPETASDLRAALSPKGRAAFDTLMQTPRFEGGAVGEGGKTSEGARAVRILIQERAAPTAFQALYDRGTTAAALYALTAFWYLRPDEYPTLVQAVRARYGLVEVATLFGCEGGREPVAALLEKKSADAVRLRPGTGLYAFMCATRKQSSFTYDFAGGAYPIEIVEGTTIALRRCARPPPLPDYLRPRR